MNVQRVPAYLYLGEEKIEIGNGLVDIDMGCVTVSLKDNLPDEVRNVFIGSDPYSVTIASESSIDPSQLCSEHKPTQHRDNKPPWCNKCGLTAEHEFPVGRLQSKQEASTSDHDFTD